MIDLFYSTWFWVVVGVLVFVWICDFFCEETRWVMAEYPLTDTVHEDDITWVNSHYRTRNGVRSRVKGHRRKVKELTHDGVLRVHEKLTLKKRNLVLSDDNYTIIKDDWRDK